MINTRRHNHKKPYKSYSTIELVHTCTIWHVCHKDGQSIAPLDGDSNLLSKVEEGLLVIGDRPHS